MYNITDMKNLKVLAFDFGASSGKALIGKFDGNKLEISEVHRFNNRPVLVNKDLYWDFLRLYHELKQGVSKAAADDIISVGIDTWGVDFGLLDKNNKLLANPYHYRHSHTENAYQEVSAVMSEKQLYKATGMPIHIFNTVCQLHMLKKNKESCYQNAEKMLFISDLFNYYLTGEMFSEFSITSTAQMMDVSTGKWSNEVLDKFGINKDILCEIIPSGTVLGEFSKNFKDELNINKKVKVVATTQHDTASAFLAVPKSNENSVFISSGTWSLLGIERDKPIYSDEALKAGYANEGGINGGIRFLKNIMGLWIIQECTRSFEAEDPAINFSILEAGAEKVKPCESLINTESKEFYSPNNMPEKIVNYCKRTGQKVPSTKFEIARCVYDSLALAYKHNILALDKITGKKTEVLHIAGGGSKDTLLNKITASAVNLPVMAGPAECTAAGNILCQLIGLKEIKNVSEARGIIKNSFPVKEFLPANTDVYNKGYEKYLSVINSSH